MGEEQEYSLYNRVKNAEYARQKREQAVRKTQSKLLERRREHANELKTKMVEMTKEERELEQRLERERAELAKVSAPHLQACAPPPLRLTLVQSSLFGDSSSRYSVTSPPAPSAAHLFFPFSSPSPSSKQIILLFLSCNHIP